MSTETALPEAPEGAGAGELPEGTPAEVTTEASEPEGQEAKDEGEKKPERHPLEKELAKERRRNQALARRTHAAEAELERLRPRDISATNEPSQADSETLSLTKAQLEELVTKRAQEIAPKIKDKAAEQERIVSAVQALRKEVGADQFEELTNDLATVFNESKQLAVLRTDAPAALIRYLTDPDNADEAERIGRMDEFDAGRALAKLEAKLEAKKAEDKPQRSKAAAPIESARGSGTSAGAVPTDIREYIKWANKQYGAA